MVCRFPNDIKELFIIKQLRLLSTYIRDLCYFLLIVHCKLIPRGIIGWYPRNLMDSFVKLESDADDKILVAIKTRPIPWRSTADLKPLLSPPNWALKTPISITIVQFISKFSSTSTSILRMSLFGVKKSYSTLSSTEKMSFSPLGAQNYPGQLAADIPTLGSKFVSIPLI